MNFDRLNPLSHYLSRNTTRSESSKYSSSKLEAKLDVKPEISDWGIEDTDSTTSYHTKPLNHYFDDVFDTPPQNSTSDFQYYYDKYNPNPIEPTTENFHKFIKKYLSIEKNDFWEKYKYKLIISNLLDDNIVLSKNEQALKEVTNEENVSQIDSHGTYINYLNHDGTELKLLEKNYRLECSPVFYNTKFIIIIINLIIHLMKVGIQGGKYPQLSHHLKYQPIPPHGYSASHLKMFKIILIISTKLIKFKKFRLLVKKKQTTHMLGDFLKYNYKLNMKIMTNLRDLGNTSIIQVKGLESSALSPSGNTSKLESRKSLSNALYFLNFNLRSSISKVFPYVNGDLLEQYCSINNINLDILTASFEDYPKNESNSLDEIIFDVNKFNQLRKFLICQLLTINEPIKKNFFLYKLMDQFGIDSGSPGFVHQHQEMDLLQDIFSGHIQVLKNFDNHLKLASDMKIDVPIEVPFETSPQLTSLITKLSNLSTNMKFFQKYNDSTRLNKSEISEKVLIFQQFNDDIDTIKELYQINLTDLLQQQEEPLSPTISSECSSPRSSIDNSTGLKSFHNSSIKKRFSLPSPASLFDKNADSPGGRKYKKLSTGLQLGLLTVFEDPKDSRKSTPHSFDDNYLNILPPPSYETYNQLTFDQLSANNPKKVNPNRFSMNSVNSNLSGITDLINSTRITSLEDSPRDNQRISEENGQRISTENLSRRSDENLSQQISKVELKLRLEESFNRIYNLENENKILKSKTTSSNVTLTYDAPDKSFPDKSFLLELEKTLDSKVTPNEG